MLAFAGSFLAWVASTAIPAFAGLLIITSVGMLLKARYLAAFALGIFLWFFVDTIGGSANLDVNAGFAGGVAQVAIVSLFVIGVLFSFSVDRNIFSPAFGLGRYGLAIPLFVAVAVGIHGLGEGVAFGGTAASTSSKSLLDAFGGLSAGVAYVLHKMLEPMMIGACYCAYSKEHAKSAVGRLGDLLLLSILFTIPSLIGAATGYFLTYDSTYFFALGTGTSIYAAVRIARPLFETANVSNSESIKIALSVILAFICIYFAALFHS